MEKLAIFGGTFNPIHCGHLLIAEAAFDQFALDRVLWVPSRLPPHKLQTLVKLEHRLEMVRLAIGDRPHFTVSDIEAKREGVSWAIDTFHDLQVAYPNAQWYWIIGADAFETMAQWRGSQAFSDQCVWLVAPRLLGSEVNEEPTYTPLKPSQNAVKVRSHLIQMSPIALSSSLIRQYCREGRFTQGATLSGWQHTLTPEPVRAYIESHKLYQL